MPKSDQFSASADELLQALISSAVDAIIVIDHLARVQLFSRGAEQLFGYRADEVLGRNVHMLMPEPYRSEHDGYIRNYRETGRRRIIGIGREVQILHRSGEVIPVDLAVGEARTGDQPLYVGIIRDLRQRSHLENMLRQERRRAERVLDLVEVVIIGVDREQRIILLNRKGGELLGDEPLPIGRMLSDFIDEDDRERVGEMLESLFSERAGGHRAAEFSLLHDGEERLLAWHHQFVSSEESGDPDLVLCSGIDITETHRVSRLLRQSEERLRLTFEQAPVGIVTLTLGGTLIGANQALADMLNIRPEQLQGIPFQALVAPTSRETFHKGFEAVASSRFEQVTVDCQLQHNAIILRTRIVMGLVHNAAGEAASLVAHVEDRTAQLAAEAELDTLQTRLAHVQRLSVMGEMAAGIAHEINQPLGAISTFADGSLRLLSADPPKLEDLNYALDQIGTQARRAGDVVRRMRAMARNEAISRKPADVNRMIQGLMSLAELEARKLEAPLRLELAEGLPEVMADEVQIQQVLLNLIRNSLEALATRSQAQQGVSVTTEATGEGVRVTVADRGVGIPPETAKKVFDPFFSSKPSGTGMGLSICSTIIRAHEGRIWHEAREAGGSRFCFELPAVRL